MVIRREREYDEQQGFTEEVLSLLRSAQSALDSGEYSDAILYSRKVLVKAPGLPVARNILGLAYLYSRQAGPAQLEFEKLVEHESDNPMYLYYLSLAYIAQSKYFDAEDVLRKAFVLDGSNMDVLSQLVTVLIHNKVYEDALKFIGEAIGNSLSRADSDCTLLLKRAKVYLAMDDKEGVAETLSEMRSTEPPLPELGKKLAHDMHRIGKELLEYASNELAVKFLETAVHFDGESSALRELHRRAVRAKLHELGSFRRVYTEKDEVVIRLEAHIATNNIAAVSGALSEIKSKASANPELDIRLAHQLQAIGQNLMDRESYKLAVDVLYVAQLLDDADRQIKYMYLRALDLSKEPQKQEKPAYSPPRRRKKFAGGWIVAVGLVALLIFYLSQDKAADGARQSPITPLSPTTPRQITRYEDGAVLLNSFVDGRHQWVIENGLDQDAVVLLTTTAEPRQTLLCIYIWANSSAKFGGVPDGMYSIYYSTGHDFDELSKSFTKNAKFGRFDKPLTFQTTGNQYTIYTMTLHGVVGGNAPTTTVPSVLFPKID